MRKRWQRFYQWWTLTRVLGALALLIGVVSVLVDLPVPPFLSDIAPELVGIGVTVLLIDSANERRATIAEKAAFILQMGSSNNDFALEAARISDQKGWLMDGTFHNAYLARANLQSAYLERANLQGAALFEANLQQAKLAEANLQGADFRGADLQGADFWEAELQGAHLEETNLEGASLRKTNLKSAGLTAANLKEANLWNANLRGAYLQAANLQGVSFESPFGIDDPPTCDENTILPDGTFWTPGRDLHEFTHPEEGPQSRPPKNASPSPNHRGLRGVKFPHRVQNPMLLKSRKPLKRLAMNLFRGLPSLGLAGCFEHPAPNLRQRP
jgi:hypothetical protein